MKEELLHYIWKTKNFDILNIETVDNQKIKIINSGFWNQDAGPDFKQAIIDIGGVTWAGDVEIHVRSSDWYRHGHETDEKYSSVILHVVYEYDKDVCLNGGNGEVIPTLELKNYISDITLQNYKRLSESNLKIACGFAIKEISASIFEEIMLTTSIGRLDRKMRVIFEDLGKCDYDWKEICFKQMANSFGFKTNAAAFDLLARSVSYKILSNHLTSQVQTYALIFGQAGLLEEEIDGDAYYEALQSEYNYLRYKYNLIPIDKKLWNKLRLRPANFHCLRLAQFCELLLNPNLMNDIFDDEVKLTSLIPKKVEPHTYWEHHYEFGKESKSHKNDFGDTAVKLLYINAIIPIRYAFGVYRGRPAVTEQAVMFQKELKFEENYITRRYREAGFPSGSALDSQAIIELSRKYCTSRKCAYCPVGNQILKKPSSDVEKGL